VDLGYWIDTGVYWNLKVLGVRGTCMERSMLTRRKRGSRRELRDHGLNKKGNQNLPQLWLQTCVFFCFLLRPVVSRFGKTWSGVWTGRVKLKNANKTLWIFQISSTSYHHTKHVLVHVNPPGKNNNIKNIPAGEPKQCCTEQKEQIPGIPGIILQVPLVKILVKYRKEREKNCQRSSLCETPCKRSCTREVFGQHPRQRSL